MTEGILLIAVKLRMNLAGIPNMILRKLSRRQFPGIRIMKNGGDR